MEAEHLLAAFREFYRRVSLTGQEAPVYVAVGTAIEHLITGGPTLVTGVLGAPEEAAAEPPAG